MRTLGRGSSVEVGIGFGDKGTILLRLRLEQPDGHVAASDSRRDGHAMGF
jgi:hypothetical protein